MASKVKNLFSTCILLWGYFGIFILIVAIFIVALRLVLAIFETPSSSILGRAEAYSSKPWAKEYLQELDSSSVRWESYVYWRTKAVKGRYINVSADGVRATPDSHFINVRGDKPRNIFFFGGSTMWGLGSPDAYTIPALVAEKLRSQDFSYNITNFGEHGYVSTQELILLIRQLQVGATPDIVIFYDGVNDAYATYQNGQAGLTHNEVRRRIEFNMLKESRFGSLLFESTVAMIQRLKNIEGLRSLILSSVGRLNDNRDTISDATIEELARIYVENIKSIKALGRQYGFTPLFFWQPTVYPKKVMSAHEAASVRQQNPSLPAFMERAYASISQNPWLRSQHDFMNLEGLFAEEKAPIFIDFCHVEEAGNRAVANRMANEILALKQN